MEASKFKEKKQHLVFINVNDIKEMHNLHNDYIKSTISYSRHYYDTKLYNNI